jgi:hypothetical protein
MVVPKLEKLPIYHAFFPKIWKNQHAYFSPKTLRIGETFSSVLQRACWSTQENVSPIRRVFGEK